MQVYPENEPARRPPPEFVTVTPGGASTKVGLGRTLMPAT